jgi:polygalacturonase
MWMIVPVGCERGRIANVQEIGECLASDGVDVVGCRDILIEDCQFQNHDDCIVVKALMRDEGPNKSVGMIANGCHDVENILVRRCIFENTQGIVFEIGHELLTKSVKNVRFTDSDVLHSHNGGSIIGIHNCDYAVVSDVLFEDIRVEHYWDKFIDLRVMDSQWAEHGGKGQVRNITVRNIQVDHHPANTGYTICLIGGWDAEHTVSGVKIENICVNGKRLTHLNQLNLFTRHAEDIELL